MYSSLSTTSCTISQPNVISDCRTTNQAKKTGISGSLMAVCCPLLFRRWKVIRGQITFLDVMLWPGKTFSRRTYWLSKTTSRMTFSSSPRLGSCPVNQSYSRSNLTSARPKRLSSSQRIAVRAVVSSLPETMIGLYQMSTMSARDTCTSRTLLMVSSSIFVSMCCWRRWRHFGSSSMRKDLRVLPHLNTFPQWAAT